MKHKYQPDAGKVNRFKIDAGKVDVVTGSLTKDTVTFTYDSDNGNHFEELMTQLRDGEMGYIQGRIITY